MQHVEIRRCMTKSMYLLVCINSVCCFFFLCVFFLQNTYTNADKLLEAAEQLAQTGECDPEEIYKAARHLEVRIQDFVRRVEHRKLLLDMSVSFHTHTKEVGSTQTHRYTNNNIIHVGHHTCAPLKEAHFKNSCSVLPAVVMDGGAAETVAG